MRRRPDNYPMLRLADARNLKPLRPDVPDSVSRPNHRLNRSLSRFEPKPVDASILKFSKQLIENSKAYGPAGTVLALTGIALLAVSCGSAGAIPSATPEIPHTPTPTLTPTSTLTNVSTLMFAPTFTPADTLTPIPSSTPGPWNFRPSQFEAGDNDAGQNVAGVTEIVWARLMAHLDNAWTQIAKFPPISPHQGYTEAMLFSSPVREADGDVVITQKRGPDFWEKFGGFGFTLDNANRYPDKSAALVVNPADFFKIDADGIGRSLMVVQEADVEFAVFAAARAAVAANYPKENFSDPDILKQHDQEIKNLVYRAIFSDSGFDPDTHELWPGANNVNDKTDSFVDENGVVCVGHRPEADVRDQQLPEIFPKVRYDQDLELRSVGDDETLGRVDSGTGMVVTAIIDTAKQIFRVDIIDGANVPDNLRPDEARHLDNEDVPVRSRLGRWVPCGQAVQLGPEVGRTPLASSTPSRSEGTKIAPSKTPGPGETPVFTPTPTETPGPTVTLTKTSTPTTENTPTSTRVTEAPTITNQPPTDTATPGPTDAGTPTPVGADTATSAPSETQTGPTNTPFTEPIASKTPSAP